MKYIFVLSTCLFFLSCSKNTSEQISPVIDPGTTINNQDSAKVILVTAKSDNGQATSLYAYALDHSTLWEQAGLVSVSYWRKPAYSNNTIFFSTGNQLMSLNSMTGANNWTYASTTSLVNPILEGDTIAIAKTILASSPNNELLLFKKNSNAVIWSKPLTVQPIIAPLLKGNHIYCLATNATGTQTTLSAYNVTTKALIWQKIISASFLTSVPSDMFVLGDTLVTGSGTNMINVLNRNTGDMIWSKSLNTNRSFFYKDKIVYTDRGAGRLTFLNRQTGSVIFQGAAVNALMSTGPSYIYNDLLYDFAHDTIFCTNLNTGVLEWKRKPPYRYYTNFVVVGNTVYASATTLYNEPGDFSKVILLNAADFTVKDSIVVPKRQLLDVSVLSREGTLY